MNYIITTSHENCNNCAHVASKLIAYAITQQSREATLTQRGCTVEILMDPNGVGKSYARSHSVHPSTIRAEDLPPKRPTITAPDDGWGSIIQFPLERRRLNNPKDPD